MKQHIVIGSLFAAALFFTASGANMLPNGSFEKLDENNFPLRWKFYQKDADKGEIVSGDAANGKNFIRITRNSKRDAFIRSDLFRIRPGKYKISMQLRGTGAVAITLSMYHPVKTEQLSRIILTSQWQNVTLDAEIPSGKSQVSLGFRASRCADIDDVQIVPANAAENSDAVQVVNAGIPGNNSFDLMVRLTDDVLAEDPDTVILMCGTNDMLNSRKAVPFERYADNMSHIISTLQKNNVKVVLMTVPPCYEPYLLKRHPAEFFTPLAPNQKLEKLNGIIQDLAKKFKCPLVDIWTLFSEQGNIGTGKSSWLRNFANGKSSDGIHPVGIGYLHIAQAVAETLKKSGLSPKKIVCFGDSITNGIGAAKADENYPSILQKALNK